MMGEYKNTKLSAGLVEESPVKYDAGKDFVSLDAWKKSRLVKLFFYRKIVPALPVEEKYNLNIQVRKAAVSSTANIAEGYGRFNYQEGIQFYRISRGSLNELKDHLLTCFDLLFIDKYVFDEGLALIEEAKVTLNGYIKFVQSQKNNAN